VVDDGSIDNTGQIATSYPVTYIRTTNRGLSAARNIGIKVASSDRILTLDADDYIAPDLIKLALKAPEDKLLRFSMQSFGKKSIFYSPFTENTAEEFMIHNRAFACAMFPKEAWTKVGGYDESLKVGYEDWDFWVRLLKAGYLFENVPDARFYYRDHGHSLVKVAVAQHDDLYQQLLDKWGKL
jgi:glycosyltransferase involved in cell wall biosynthesis